MTRRHDERYIYDSRDRRTPILVGWWNDTPMGGWADANEDRFREAIVDALAHDVEQFSETDIVIEKGATNE